MVILSDATLEQTSRFESPTRVALGRRRGRELDVRRSDNARAYLSREPEHFLWNANCEGYRLTVWSSEIEQAQPLRRLA